MPADLDVIVTGFDVEQRQAETGMVRLFGLEPLRAKRFVEQLPVVAKRCSDTATAERYAEALRAIGARVDVRPHAAAFRDSLPPVAATSLPAPAPELTAQLRESLKVSRAADSAIARFREAEGLEPLASELGFDPYNPSIPRAPAIPHDLARMPNAALQRPSDRPDWMVADPLSLTPDASSGAPPALQPPHVDAQRPPRGRPSRDSGMRPRRNTPEPNSAVGMAHAARASVRPGMSAHTPTTPAVRLSWRRRIVRLWPLALGVLALAAAAAWQAGWLRSDADGRRETWRSEGIVANDHEEVRAFLAKPGHAVRGIGDDALRALLDKLERAGVPSIYAIDITAVGAARHASALLITLPADSAARQTVRFYVAEAQGRGSAPTLDRGGHYQVIAFE